MRKSFSKIALSAGFALALAFTLSCSDSKDDGGGENNSSGGTNNNSSGSGSEGGCPNASTGSNTVTCGGKTYKTVKIGTQVWMAENLNYAVEGSKCYGEDGPVHIDEISEEYDITLSNSEIQANCEKYGRLYEWETMMILRTDCLLDRTCKVGAKHRGICPSGWHIPSSADWETLTSFIEKNRNCTGCAAKHLKAANGWHEYKDEYEGFKGNGTDYYGFAALPGGQANYLGFRWAGSNGYWWDASPIVLSNWVMLYVRTMNSTGDDISTATGAVSTGLFQSVRCVMD